RHEDLLPLRRVPTQAGEVHLGPVLPRSLQTVRDVPPDRTPGLPGDLPEFPDNTVEMRVRLGGLGHEKGLGATPKDLTDLNIWVAASWWNGPSRVRRKLDEPRRLRGVSWETEPAG